MSKVNSDLRCLGYRLRLSLSEEAKGQLENLGTPGWKAIETLHEYVESDLYVIKEHIQLEKSSFPILELPSLR
ncbi:MAG: hypothetical protein AAGF76_00635 [Pseudomonadota bacterium]